MKKSILTRVVFIAIGLPLLAGCVTRVVYTQAPPPASPPPNAVVEEPAQPPPPQVDVIPPQPDVTFVWVPGAWVWRGNWVWVHGYWGPRPHPGAMWVGAHWEHHRHGYVWVGGYWR